MARAPAAVPTITSPNASAAAFRCRRTSLAESTLVLLPDAECTQSVGAARRISARIRKPAERGTAPGRPCRFLLKRFAIAFLRWHSDLQTTHAYVDRPTRVATAVHVRRHGPLDRRPGSGGHR